MAIRWLLFETRFGGWLLSFLEQKVRLAVVSVDWLERQPAGVPTQVGGPQ